MGNGTLRWGGSLEIWRGGFGRKSELGVVMGLSEIFLGASGHLSFRV